MSKNRPYTYRRDGVTIYCDDYRTGMAVVVAIASDQEWAEKITDLLLQAIPPKVPLGDVSLAGSNTGTITHVNGKPL